MKVVIIGGSGFIGVSAGSLFVFKGKYRAVLIITLFNSGVIKSLVIQKELIHEANLAKSLKWRNYIS